MLALLISLKMNTAHQTFKLGNNTYRLRDTPLSPPIISTSKQLKIENEQLKQQVNALITKESKIEEIQKKLEPQYQFFTKPTIAQKKKPTKQELIDKMVAEKLKERELNAKMNSNKKGAR